MSWQSSPSTGRLFIIFMIASICAGPVLAEETARNSSAAGDKQRNSSELSLEQAVKEVISLDHQLRRRVNDKRMKESPRPRPSPRSKQRTNDCKASEINSSVNSDYLNPIIKRCP